MEKFILELIKENNRVIIPNFGAFIISKDKGLNVLFNNFLSFNDGLLVTNIAEKKGIAVTDATDEVFGYVDNLKKVLDEKGEYVIASVGIFNKDDNGILHFTQDESLEASLMSSSSADDTAKTTSGKSDATAPPILLDIDDTSAVAEVTEEEESEAVVTDASSDKYQGNNEPLLHIDKEAEENKEVEEVSAASIDDAPKVDDAGEQTSDESDKKPPVNEYIEKDIRERKRKNKIIFILIGALLLIGVLVYFLFFTTSHKNDDIKVQKEMEHEVLQHSAVPDSVAVVKDTAVVNEELLVVKEVEKKVPVSKKEFYVIVGSFKMESNATNMLAKLQTAGLKKAQIIPKGSMYLVSADSDVSFNKVETMQQQIMANHNMGSWIYQIK